ncbi:alpha-ketoglutarate-dependent dioxygenase AlkB [Streptomyces sp. NPDC057429]|uniref:alpha-ketoglutarate-dependent dioxygenase AlkB n=1 Tax=Streptomyces sp. NPDC057429 TaxID=3346130 RepID=UPI003685BCB6
MRQDKEGRSGAPVVSLSLGHTCVFGFGDTRDRGRPCNDVEWVCGDLFVSGGPSRYAFHGSTKVFEATAGPASGMRAGRLDPTWRETGSGATDPGGGDGAQVSGGRGSYRRAAGRRSAGRGSRRWPRSTLPCRRSRC